MTVNHTLLYHPLELWHFRPVRGTWHVDVEPGEDRDQLAIEKHIAAAVTETSAALVNVRLFDAHGLAIEGRECPSEGLLLVEREIT
jgi:hypothetical protein